MSRDHGRTPVQWDAAAGAGFTTGTPWIGINPDHVEWNTAAQVGVEGSVFEYYRQLIALRHTDAVVTEGDFELLVPEHPTVWAYLRRTPAAELLVAANFSAEEAEVELPLGEAWAEATVVLSNLAGAAPPAPPGTRLEPWRAVVWRLAC
jgi:oligo-1,6-glucosidase